MKRNCYQATDFCLKFFINFSSSWTKMMLSEILIKNLRRLPFFIGNSKRWAIFLSEPGMYLILSIKDILYWGKWISNNPEPQFSDLISEISISNKTDCMKRLSNLKIRIFEKQIFKVKKSDTPETGSKLNECRGMA